jgi:hypothetical protein
MNTAQKKKHKNVFEIKPPFVDRICSNDHPEQNPNTIRFYLDKFYPDKFFLVYSDDEIGKKNDLHAAILQNKNDGKKIFKVWIEKKGKILVWGIDSQTKMCDNQKLITMWLLVLGG